MAAVMNDQDKRTVESMCRCGLELEGVIAVFPAFPREDVMAVYNSVKGLGTGVDGKPNVSINCS